MKKKIKNLMSSLVLLSPVAIFAACYGPMPYNCEKDSDCTDYPDGECFLETRTEGYCLYGPEKGWGGYIQECDSDTNCKIVNDFKDTVCGYIDKQGTKHNYCYSECLATSDDYHKCIADSSSDATSEN